MYWRREKRAWEHDSQGGVKHGKQKEITKRKATQKWRAAGSFIFLITPPPFQEPSRNKCYLSSMYGILVRHRVTPGLPLLITYCGE